MLLRQRTYKTLFTASLHHKHTAFIIDHCIITLHIIHEINNKSKTLNYKMSNNYHKVKSFCTCTENNKHTLFIKMTSAKNVQQRLWDLIMTVIFHTR